VEAIEMDISGYFAKKGGIGVLATADSEGKVDAAVYARPHVVDAEHVAFIMRDRLTHANLQSNSHAAYLFMEDRAQGYAGVRLLLTKTAEEQDTERLHALRRKKYKEPEEKSGPLYLVFFKVDKILPLVGSGESEE
jgi:hypothetical protein